MENMNYTQVQLLKAKEVAQVLNISRALAYQLVQAGTIPSVRINSSVRVHPVDLEAYIQSARVTNQQ